MMLSLRDEIDTWHGRAPARLVEASLRIAGAIAERLADPQIVATYLFGGYEDNEEAPASPLELQTFSHGLPGVIVLLTELDAMAPDRGWDARADTLIRALMDSLQRHGMGLPGLFVGGAGQSFAVWSASRGRTRYRTLLRNLDAGVATLTEDLLDQAHHRKGNCAVSDYDVVQGLAGIGRYLAHRTDSCELKSLLERTLGYLIGLSQPISHRGMDAPGWFVPQAHQMTLADSEAFPAGSFNTGLAHGIAGPLALLSLTHRAGHGLPGQAEAIARVAAWLVDVAGSDGEVLAWPGQIPWDAHRDGARVAVSNRIAWCYGVPGVARSLYLAGLALGDASLSRIAVASFRQCLCASPVSRLAPAPTLCHGQAGILQLALRMGGESGDGDIKDVSRTLIEALVDRYEPASPIGYRDVEETTSGPAEVTKAGFLNGAAGVALGLATYGAAVPPLWDSAMLMA